MKIILRPIGPLLKSKSPSLSDILAHTNKPFASSDKVTVAHETTHEINNFIANANGTRSKNVGLYVLNDAGYVLDEPKITIREVAALVPHEFRGFTPYKLYLQDNGPEWWNSEPLYLMDEWVAYSNASQCALELSNAGDFNSNWSEIQNAVLFSAYVGTLCNALQKKGQLPLDIKDFFCYHARRVESLYEQSRTVANMKHADTDRLMFTLKSSSFYNFFTLRPGTDDYL